MGTTTRKEVIMSKAQEYSLIAVAVEMFNDGDAPEDYTLEEWVDEFMRDAYRDAEMDSYYRDDEVSPWAYQQDVIDLYRFER